ncbi:MAG: nucleotidyltransferase family protein [Clostridia bacterium]|nr:nucleotidyltransferase family protein [Clostridia bacterium]
MKISGIICEYNPLHNGHAYLLTEAKRRSDAVVCVMSGPFTQRGEVAILDKFVRARMALVGGADLVLELPPPFCSSSAAYFAEAGVSILSMLGTSTLVFGSESGDLARLSALADRVLSQAFAEQKEAVDLREGSATAHFAALLGEGERLQPNDILAVEYLCALKRLNTDMTAEPIVRVGDGFGEKALGASPFASATAIRKALAEGESVGAYMPDFAFSELVAARERGEAPATAKNAERAILGFFRLTAPEALSHIAGLGSGLEHRLCAAALESRTLDEMTKKCATKRYPDATIRRAILAAMLGVTWEDLDRGVTYTTVLGANGTGRALLASLRKRNLPILTKPSDTEALCQKHPESAEAMRRQAELSARADALYSLCLPKTAEAGKYLRTDAVML